MAKHTRRNIPRLVAFIAVDLVILLLVIYFGFVIFFRGHYFWHTSIGSVSCGGKSVSYVTEQNEQNVNDYLLTIYDCNGNKFHLTGRDFDCKYVNSGAEEAILKKQNPFTWPAHIKRKTQHTITGSISYDSDKLKQAIQALGIFSQDYIKAPVDAQIKLTDKSYEITPEDKGNTPILDNILTEVIDCIEQGEVTLTLSDACYVQPKVLASDDALKGVADQIDAYTSAVITYQIDGADEKLTSEKIFKMLQIEGTQVTINEKEVAKYAQYLASTYNTYGRKRAFKTTVGDVVEVSGGDYGWVVQKAEEAAQIIKDLTAGKPVSREPVYEQTANGRGEKEIGSTYLEIDYTNQHFYYYKDGNLVLDSDIVSGTMSTGLGSPDGIFKIQYCERNAVLKGETYTTPVAYFMPFAYNVGFHDATWRNGKFGGEYYKTGGSHGCINLPADVAKNLYDNLSKGTPVIAYYREPVVLTSESAKIGNAKSYVAPQQ